MFRRYSAKSTTIPPPWLRSPLQGRCLAGFAFGILGTLYYARSEIYADTSSNATRQNHVDSHYHHHRDDNQNEIPERWNSPYGETVRLHGERGIGRVDAAAVPSASCMSPCSYTSVDINGSPTWSFLGLFDPHNGCDNMGFVSSSLIPTVTDALFNLLSIHGSPSTEHVEVGMSPLHTPQVTSEELSSDAVDNAIKKAFLDVDCAVVDHAAEIIFSSPSKAAAIIPLSVALSGTSALLTFYDHDTRLLKVAVAGSSRAVLGRRAERKNQDQRSSYYEVHVLTTDQLRNPFDQAQHVHSGSDEAMLTRGFGLSAYKWSDDIQERLHQEYLGDPPTPHIKMYAEPEITTIEVKPGDFLIMASAGLWQSLTSEEAVGLVGLWLDKGMYHALPSVTTPVQQLPTLSSVQITHPLDLPVSLGAKDETVMYRKWGAEKRFVCIDTNVAGHLSRNALGGADGDLTEALLNVEPPLSRKLRSDINTAVIFFDGQL